MDDLAAHDSLISGICGTMRGDVDGLQRASRRVLVIVSVNVSVVLLASVISNSLPDDIVSLGLHAFGHLTLQEFMVTLIVFLCFKIFCRSRAMTDLNRGVASTITRIIASACKSRIIVVIVDDNDLADDLFKSLVVIASLSTPLNELSQTVRLDHLTAPLPVAKRCKESIIISVRVSDPCNDGKLHAAWERNVCGTANTLGLFVPGVSNNFLEIILWDPWKQLPDCCTNLFRGFFVALHAIKASTMLCKSLGDDTVVLLLQQIGSCDEGVFVGDIAQGFASFFNYLAAEMIPDAVDVVRYFCWIVTIVVFG